MATKADTEPRPRAAPRRAAPRRGAAQADAAVHEAATEARPRRYDPSETRARVLEAAYQLFMAQGYSQTGTADIARAAEVSEGSIFYHFGSKAALLAELGRLHGEKMVAAMQRDDPFERLTFRVTLERCFAFCETNRAWDKIVEDGSECPPPGKPPHHFNPEAEVFYMAAREVTEAWVRAHLRAIEEHFGSTGIDVDIAASLIFATVGEALNRYFQPGLGAEEKRRIREECIRFLTRAAGHPALAD